MPGRKRSDDSSRRSPVPPERDKQITGGVHRRSERPETTRTTAQAEYDGPPLDSDITGAEIAGEVKSSLRSLPEKLALRVARHLVAAGRLLDTDPETAYRHTLAARARAGRIALVREACGESAYAADHFKEALAEFQAARRINGSPLYLPLLADCERALGRPERALALAQDPAVQQLDAAGRIEMRIVESGARRDLGDLRSALRALDLPALHQRGTTAGIARLRYAYADTLLAAGQDDAALEWFHRAAGADPEGGTDAADRIAELEGLHMVDLLEDAASASAMPVDATDEPQSTAPS